MLYLTVTEYRACKRCCRIVDCRTSTGEQHIRAIGKEVLAQLRSGMVGHSQWDVHIFDSTLYRVLACALDWLRLCGTRILRVNVQVAASALCRIGVKYELPQPYQEESLEAFRLSDSRSRAAVTSVELLLTNVMGSR